VLPVDGNCGQKKLVVQEEVGRLSQLERLQVVERIFDLRGIFKELVSKRGGQSARNLGIVREFQMIRK